MTFTKTRTLALAAAVVAAPLAAALLIPLKRVEFARAIGIPLECPTGWILESERAGEAECVRAKHPESLWDGVLRRDPRLSPSSAAYPPIPEGAYRAAVEQKTAMSSPAAQALIPGASGTWQPYGIGPLHTTDGSGDVSGRIDSFDYDATHGRVFATLGTGGVWMSTDKGANWTSIGDNLPSQIVGSVAWSSAGPDSTKGTLVVAGGDPSSGGDDYAGLGAYWSDDLGANWHAATGVPDGALGYKAAVDKNSPNIVYLGLSKGLFRSTDTGHSYTRIDLPVGGGCDAKYEGECYLAHFVTDIVIKTPGVTDVAPLNASPLNAPVGSVLVAVGYRAGAKPFTHDPAHVHSPGNGLYRSTTGLAGSFTKLNVSAPSTDSPYGFTTQERIGRISLGPAIGAAQDHNYVYALVQDAVTFNGYFPYLDNPTGTLNPPTTSPVPFSLVNGLYVSPDFGSHWIRMADTQELAYNPTNESALYIGGATQFYLPGVQGYYNLWVRPDPTVQTPGAGIPTRLMFGLEEPWASRTSTVPLDGIAQQGQADFHVIGEYWATLHNNTTHPDQHAGVWIPDNAADATQGVAGTGVTVLIGNDGGAYSQHVAPGDEPDNDSWGNGANIGFHTLLPYAVAVAKDGTVYFGLQDNGSGHINPDDQSHHETIGGDGFYAAVDPDNSNIGYSEYTYGVMRVTTNRGASWSTITPPGASSSTALFSMPFVMDPTDAKHIVAVANSVTERLQGPTGSWVSTYNLGTRTAGGSTVNNIGSAVDVQGSAVYVAFCGVCDVLNKQAIGFKVGIATNVSVATGAPTAKGVVNTGWHKPAALGLPNRYIDDIEIDAADPRIVYVTLGGYANRGWNPPGSYGDTNADLGTGNVYKSTDAGEHFTNVSGNLPNAHATAIVKRGTHLIVGTDVGIFISSDLDGTTWAALGNGLPNVPVAEMQLKPGDDSQLFIASFGRGFWRYTFTNEATNTAPVATLSADVTSGDAPLAVQFAVGGTDADGDALTFDLDFGDSSAHSSSSGAVTHGYATAGDYTATLTVSDGKGGTDVKTVAIHATQAPPPNHAPVATLSPATATIHAGEAVQFEVGATDEDGDTLTVDLDFGDDTAHSSQTGANGHTYAAEGSYTATLTVSDGRGGVATRTSEITVQAATIGSLVVHLSADKNGGDVTDRPLLVTFTATVENDDGTPMQYTFAFGDGETSTFTQGTNVISHEYAYAGTYHPYVTATQDMGARAATSGADEATIVTTSKVTVDPGLAAKLIYDFPSGNVAPANVVFSTDGSSGASWSMTFGDGSEQHANGTPPASISHSYAAPREYTATLTVFGAADQSGTSAAQSQTFTLVASQELTAQLQVSTSHGTAPLTVTFDGCHSVPGNGAHIASFTMHFGDGTPDVTQGVDGTHAVSCAAADRSTDPSVFVHTYTSGGTFVPVLTVTDDSASPNHSSARYSSGVEVAAAPVETPVETPASSGGHRGGAFGWLTLVPLLGAALRRRRGAMGAVLGALALAVTGSAQAGGSGTLSENSPPMTYVAGPFFVANVTPIPTQTNSATCNGFVFPQIDGQVTPCDHYKLTVDLPSDYAARFPNAVVKVTASWVDTADATPAAGMGVSDYDLYIFNGDRATNDGFDTADSSSASGANPEIATFHAKSGSNVYSLFIAPYTPSGETVNVKVELVPGSGAGAGGGGTSAPVAGPSTDGLACGTSTVFGGADPVCARAARFQLFKPDAANENNGQQNGEFNIGFNPKTGNIMTMSVTFPGKVFAVTPPEVATAGAPESGESTWADRSSLWESLPAVVGDPILWTDQETGRTFEANLIYGPNVSYAFTDDDGKTWTNAGISGVMGFDHETIGSGPYPAGSPFEAIAKARGYVGKDGKGRQVYYCSQDNPAVYPNGLPSGIPGGKTLNTCVRSDDGGLTWSPVQIAGDGSVCGFIHGHLHVAPDGTAYLPNSHCGARQGGFYTSDAGLTWSPFMVPASTGLDSGSDPSIAIDDANKLYYCYVNADGRAHVQVGKRNADNTLTWGKDTDIGASHGILNANFVEAVGGDANRAACGFLGSDKAGNAQSLDFPGVWYVYVAMTFDGGDTWTTVNATPNDPVQGAGGIWLQGGSVANRNLLDFNEITMDDKGRVIYGFNDGCVTSACIADPTYLAPGHSSKEFQAKMRVLRQTGGQTLRAAYDSQFASLRAPGRPSLSGTPSAGGLVLKWTAPDHGGSAITGYTVNRTPTGQTGTAKTFAITDKTTLTDVENVSGNGYAYRVTASNDAGTSQPSNAYGEAVVTPPESACTFPGVKLADDPAGPEAAAALAIPQPGTPSQLDMRALYVSEVYTSATDKTLTFSIDVSDLSSIPPSSSWSVQWTQPDTTGTSRTLWVQASNTKNTPPDTTLHGNYAFNDTGGTTSQCGSGACPVSVSVDTANKRLLIKLDTSNPLTFTSLGTGTTFTAAVGKGTVLGNAHGITQMYLGVPGVIGATPTIDQTVNASYTLVGNAACKPNTAPVAALGATPRSGTAPLVVSFTVTASDPDSGDTVSYDLNFGDGTAHAIGTGSGIVSHTYAEGTWSASLTVTDNHGLASMDGLALQATPAQVNHAPTATLTPPSASIIAGDTVTFTATGADSDAGDTLTYDLNYGDGTTHATTPGQHPHAYTRAGTFTAALQVTDSAGAHDLQVSTITVAANHAPVATLSPSAPVTIHAGEAVSFDVGASDEDGDVLTVDLDFGDQTAHGTQTGIVGHTYAAEGHYTATLTVADGRDGVATKTADITVQPATSGSLAVHLSADRRTGDVTDHPLLVTFTATVENDDGTPMQYTFAFGDGETSTFTQGTNVISHEYAYAGTYHPYVTATQDMGARAATSGPDEAVITTTAHVVVEAGLTAKLIYDFPSGNVAPASVVFGTDGSSGASWSIAFGDGDEQHGNGAPPASISHAYAAPREYTATLTVYDAADQAGHAIDQSQTFTLVARQALTAQLQVSTSHGTAPLTVTFDGCHSVAGNGQHIMSFTMHFGDGTPDVTQVVDGTHAVSCAAANRTGDPSLFTHTYTTAGTFEPTLTVTDDAASPNHSSARLSTGVEVVPATVVETPVTGGGGGGGGGFGWLTLIPMFGAALVRRRRIA